MEQIKSEAEEALVLSSSLSDTIRGLESQLKSLKKRVGKTTRALETKLDRAVAKKSRKMGGVCAPVPLSLELCKFLDKPEGTHEARTEVTRQINRYIVANNLQVPSNRSFFEPDAKLRDLLGTSESLSFFALQGYMNKHFRSRACSQVEAEH